MIFKDIAEWEVGDSELAQHTITNLHSEIDRLNKKIERLKNDKEQLNSLVNSSQKEIRRLKSENDIRLNKNIELVFEIDTLNENLGKLLNITEEVREYIDYYLEKGHTKNWKHLGYSILDILDKESEE